MRSGMSVPDSSASGPARGSEVTPTFQAAITEIWRGRGNTVGCRHYSQKIILLVANPKEGLVSRNTGMTRQLWSYMRVRRKFWLLPIMLMMMLVGALMIFAQGSPLAPFIYTIF